MAAKLNIAMSIFLALLCAYAILSHKVQDGAIVKTGLIMFSLGSFGVAMSDTVQALSAAVSLVYGGIIVCVCGYLIRKRAKGSQRRASDWAAL